MDSDVVLTRVEEELVEALEHLALGREVLGVPCHEALAAAQGHILDALGDIIRLHRDGKARAA